jgi:hypothetical protein
MNSKTFMIFGDSVALFSGKAVWMLWFGVLKTYHSFGETTKG